MSTGILKKPGAHSPKKGRKLLGGKLSPRASLLNRRQTLSYYPSDTLKVGDILLSGTECLLDQATHPGPIDATWKVLEVAKDGGRFHIMELVGVEVKHLEQVRALLTGETQHPLPLRMEAHLCTSKDCDSIDRAVHLTQIRILKGSEVESEWYANMVDWKRPRKDQEGAAGPARVEPGPDELGLGDLARDLGLGGAQAELPPLPPPVQPPQAGGADAQGSAGAKASPVMVPEIQDSDIADFIKENYKAQAQGQEIRSKRLGVVLIERAIKRRKKKVDQQEIIPDEGERRKKKRKKKRKKGSGSTSTSESSSLELEREKKVLAISRAQPGRLALTTMKEAARLLRHKTGDVTDEQLPPILGQYVKLCLDPLLSNAGSRTESRTLGEVADCLLRGELPQALDIILQRIKSIELATRSGGYAVASQMELVEVAPDGLANDREKETAAKAAAQVQKVQGLQRGSNLRLDDGRRPQWRDPRKGDGKDGSRKGGEGSIPDAEGTSRPSALKRSDSPNRGAGGRVTFAARPFPRGGKGGRGKR